MRYFRTEFFKRTYQSLDPTRKKRVDRALRQLEVFYSESQRPFGLGLKALRSGVWEIRSGLADRIIFRRSGDSVEFILVGSHDEIKRFLKQA